MLSLLKQEIAMLLSQAAGVTHEEALSSLELPKGQFGDLASTVAFSLAKRERKNPVQIAAEIAKKVNEQINSKSASLISKVESAGPYINFFYSDFAYAKIASEKAKPAKKRKEKALIEFPSVNPNKPWHIGHLRNAVLGDSVARILEEAGFAVEREDYIDDLGLQVAQSVWGYSHFKQEPNAKKFDHFLGEQYVEVAKLIVDKKIEAEVRALLHELEEGNGKNAKLGREIVEKCVKAQYETAFALGIYHDVLVFESDIVRTIFKEGLEKIKQSPAIITETGGKNKGCLVAKMSGAEFEGMESPDKVLIRSDGTATYTGKDVIFQLWKFGLLKSQFKFEKFMGQPTDENARKIAFKTETGSISAKTSPSFGRADIVINVIGMEQAYPQKVIAEIFRALGYKKQAGNSIHLAYEHVGLEDAKFSGRQGTWIGFTADELIEEGKRKAYEKITKEMDETEKRSVASAVAIGAIRYSLLHVSPERKITFKWEEALNFEGDSAPYLMYAHARCCRILEKANEKKIAKAKTAAGYSYSPDEKSLLKLIAQYEGIVQKAASAYRPNVVTDYALDIATAFGKFYNTSPVLADDVPAEARIARLEIVNATKITLAKSLSLLGIEAIEKM
jgi:arginyl-tRNA synthetase